MEKSITITNAKIVDFYVQNPHLDCEQMNLLFIDILNSLSTDLTKTIENSKFGELRQAIGNLKEEVHTIKKEYTQEVQSALKTNSLESIDKVTSMLERNTSSLMDKTSNMLNEIIPKAQYGQQKHVEAVMKEFHDSISADTKRLLETNNTEERNADKLIEGLDNRFANLINQIQQPLLTSISATEERIKGDLRLQEPLLNFINATEEKMIRDGESIQKIENSINDKIDQVHEPLMKFIAAREERMKTELGSMRESTIIQAKEQEKMAKEVAEFLNKYKNSTTTKGAISENMLYEILQNIFPCDEIVDCRSMTASGDFIVNRQDTTLPSILIENKDYKANVDTREVTKFERDVRERKCHGVFLSQSSPITFKGLYQIDIIDGLIHVYVPNAGFNKDKIQIAVQIIDHLSPALVASKGEHKDTDTMVSLDEIERIAEEYRKFSTKRAEMIDFIKNTHNTMLSNMEEFVLPSLQSLLVSIGKAVPDDPLTCKYCRCFKGKSKASLAAHVKRCKFAPSNQVAEKKETQQITDVELTIDTNT